MLDSGAWTAIFTLALTVSTGLMWWETRKLAKRAEEQAELNEEAIKVSKQASEAAKDSLVEFRNSSAKEFRAYIRVDVVGGSVKREEKICFECELVNYGRTPARDVAFSSALLVRPTGWSWGDEPNEHPPGEVPSITLHPGDEFPSPLDSDFILSSAAYDQVRSGKATIYARGTVDYVDVLGSKWKTQFSIEFSGEACFARGAPIVSAKGNWAT